MIVRGRVTFPFASELFTLFFERFPATIPIFLYDFPPRPRTNACMQMWGQLFPKRSHSNWSCTTVGKDVCDLLDLEDDCDVLDLVLYPYIGMDWRGCVNIQFTKDDPSDDRGYIILMF